jgi:hypothetical protein
MRISGRFARKMAENDQNTPIWHRLEPFIYLGLKRKNPTMGRVPSSFTTPVVGARTASN